MPGSALSSKCPDPCSIFKSSPRQMCPLGGDGHSPGETVGSRRTGGRGSERLGWLREVKNLWGPSPAEPPSTLRHCRQDPQHSGIWHPGYAASHPPLPESLAHTGSLLPLPPHRTCPPHPTPVALSHPGSLPSKLLSHSLWLAHLAPPQLYPRDRKISETIGHLSPRWERCLGIGGEGGGEGRGGGGGRCQGKEELGFLEWPLLSQHPRASWAITVNLGAHRTLPWGPKTCIWAMAHQALGLQRLRAPHLIMGFITHKGLFI